MTRTSNRPPSIRSPSVESRKEEEEEDSSEEEPRPFDQPRQVFRSNGKPIFFAFHGLTAEEEAELTGLIVERGGQIAELRKLAHTIICSRAEYDDFKPLYDHDMHTYVEEPDFIERCINQGKYEHLVPLPKGMGGRPGGSQPGVRFTEQDVDNLCRFLAVVIPYPDYGGRTGRGVYDKQQAIAMARNNTDPELRWILRHTAESWRNYYKTHMAELDPRIDYYVRRQPPRIDRKGQYYLNRKYRRGLGFDVEVEVDEEEENRDISTRTDEDHSFNAVKRRRQASPLSFVDPAVSKRRRLEVRRISDMELGRNTLSVNQSRRSLHEPERISGTTLLDRTNPQEISDGEIDIHDEAVNNWLSRPGPDEAGPSGTQRSPSPQASPIFLPERASAVVPIRARPKDKPTAALEPEPAPIITAALPPRVRKKTKRLQTSPPRAFLEKASPFVSTNSNGIDRVPSAVRMLPPPPPTYPKSSQATLVDPEPSQLRRGVELLPVESEADDPPPVAVKPRKQAQPKVRKPQAPASTEIRRRLRSASAEPLPIRELQAAPVPAPVSAPVLEPVEEDVDVVPPTPTDGDGESTQGAMDVDAYLRSSMGPVETGSRASNAVDSDLEDGHSQLHVIRNFSVSPPNSSDFSEDDITAARKLTQEDEDEDDPDDPVVANLLAQSNAALRKHSTPRITSMTPTPRTPDTIRIRPNTRQQLRRKSSDRSRTTAEEDFPIAGTRAERLLKSMENAPFTPLPGTRAAAEVRRRSGNSVV